MPASTRRGFFAGCIGKTRKPQSPLVQEEEIAAAAPVVTLATGKSPVSVSLNKPVDVEEEFHVPVVEQVEPAGEMEPEEPVEEVFSDSEWQVVDHHAQQQAPEAVSTVVVKAENTTKDDDDDLPAALVEEEEELEKEVVAPAPEAAEEEPEQAEAPVFAFAPPPALVLGGFTQLANIPDFGAAYKRPEGFGLQAGKLTDIAGQCIPTPSQGALAPIATPVVSDMPLEVQGLSKFNNRLPAPGENLLQTCHIPGLPVLNPVSADIRPPVSFIGTGCLKVMYTQGVPPIPDLSDAMQKSVEEQAKSTEEAAAPVEEEAAPFEEEAAAPVVEEEAAPVEEAAAEDNSAAEDKEVSLPIEQSVEEFIGEAAAPEAVEKS